MFALLALLCFILALLKVAISVDLVILGWCFVAAHLAFGPLIAIPTWRREVR